MSADECRDNSFWELWDDGQLIRYGQEMTDDYGTLSFLEYARLMKRKSALQIVEWEEVKINYETGRPWDWFLWNFVNVDQPSFFSNQPTA